MSQPIQVDDRTGSDRLGRQLKKLRAPVEMCRLEFGDASFIGNGPDGRPVSVGIEYKLVSDALACMADGRFAGHQLIGLTQSYEAVILLIEGATRPSSPDGVLEIRHARGFWYRGKIGTRVFMYREFANWLNTMAFRAGVRIMRAGDLAESAMLVHQLYSWFTSKDWEDHRSHLALTDAFRDDANLVKPSLVRRLAKELPQVGWTRSAAVARHFRTPFDMVLADESEWRKIDGVGKDTATKVVNALHGT